MMREEHRLARCRIDCDLGKRRDRCIVGDLGIVALDRRIANDGPLNECQPPVVICAFRSGVAPSP